MINNNESSNLIFFFLFLVKPLLPEIEVISPKNSFFKIDEKFEAICISRDGRPPSTLEWFIDNEPITEGLDVVETTESLDNRNSTLYTTSQRITRYIKATDDRKQLTCRASNIADRGEHPEAKLQFKVRCKYWRSNMDASRKTVISFLCLNTAIC